MPSLYPNGTMNSTSVLHGMDFPVTRYRQVTGVALCSLCLVWISFSLRAYVRIAILKFLGKEDWLTVSAMIIFTAFCSLCLRATYWGLGAHMDEIPPQSLMIGFKIIFICELLYVISTTVTKASVATYFLRLSSKKYQKTIIYINFAAVIIFSWTYFLFLLFQCHPVQHMWHQFLGHDGQGSCLRGSLLANITYAHGTMSAVTDWVFGLLPISFVWNMHMNPRTKLSVILILSLGFFASSATIVRIMYIKRLTQTTDFSWEGINVTKWSIVEPAIAITAMNIATLRPLFQDIFDFTFRSKRMSTELEEDDAHIVRQARNSVIGKEFSEEFSNLLGLNRTGVATEITVGSRKKRFSLVNIPEGHEALKRELTGGRDHNIPTFEIRAPTDPTRSVIKATTVIIMRIGS